MSEYISNLTKNQKLQEEVYDFPYHYLDLKVEEYKLVHHIEYLSYVGIIKDLLKPFNGQLILDAGCGDGRFCFEMKKENVKIIGVDYSEKAIRFAEAFSPEVDFYVQDLKNLNFTGEKFDQIVLIETLEHFIPEETSGILRNLYNILKKTGILIITVPSKNLRLTEKHYQHFTENTLKETLRDYFEIIKIIGHSKSGFQKKVFINLQRVGLLIFPFRDRIKPIKNYYRFLKHYYQKNLEKCKPEEGERLIVICIKSSSKNYKKSIEV